MGGQCYRIGGKGAERKGNTLFKKNNISLSSHAPMEGRKLLIKPKHFSCCVQLTAVMVMEKKILSVSDPLPPVEESIPARQEHLEDSSLPFPPTSFPHSSEMPLCPFTYRASYQCQVRSQKKQMLISTGVMLLSLLLI